MPRIDDIRPNKRKEGIDKFSNFDPSDGRDTVFDLPNFNLSKEKVISKFSNPKLIKSIRHHRLKFDLNYSYKTLFASALVCFLIVFSLGRMLAAKNSTEKLSKEARDHLEQSFTYIENGDMEEAIKEADEAKKDIGKLKLLAQSWGQDIQYLRFASASNSKFLASERLLNASYDILNAISSISNDLGKSLNKGIISSSTPSTAGVPSIDLDLLGKTIDNLFKGVVSDLEKSKDSLIDIKDVLPPDFKETNSKAAVAIDNALERANLTRSLFREGLPGISGKDGSPKNVLIILQNNSELRGSGGFIGSYSVATFSEGKMSKLEFQTNIYKLDTEFTSKTKLAPPEDLAYISPQGWALRDSNFAVDFPESAGKISELYSLETGKNIDSIVAMDTTLFTDILRVIGPIEMPEYGKTITADNFLSDIQYEVEKGYFERSGGKETNEPKTILADMMPKFFNKLMESTKDSSKLFEIMEVFNKSLKEKHLVFNFNEKNTQEIIEKLGYAGKVEPCLSDYLFVNNTNIGGMKSSLNIEESLKHKVAIELNGDIFEQLEINKKHNGSNNWPDGVNNNLVRVLIPQDSKFADFKEVEGNFWPLSDEKNKKSSDHTFGSEAGKAKLSFWQNTKPGETSKSIFEYQSNYHVETTTNFNYSLYLQKQPGALTDDYELELTYPEGFKPVNVANYNSKDRIIVLKYSLKQDKKINIKFEKIR